MEVQDQTVQYFLYLEYYHVLFHKKSLGPIPMTPNILHIGEKGEEKTYKKFRFPFTSTDCEGSLILRLGAKTRTLAVRSHKSLLPIVMMMLLTIMGRMRMILMMGSLILQPQMYLQNFAVVADFEKSS